MNQVPQAILNLRERVAVVPTQKTMRDSPLEAKPGRQKYGNIKTVLDGVKFDSKAEAKRWAHLSILQKGRQISGLERQVAFELIPKQVTPSGRTERACSYVCDFRYRTKDGKVVVEDVKGAVTPEYRIKRKLMLHVHGIDVIEIKS